jgi:hypothetical protein
VQLQPRHIPGLVAALLLTGSETASTPPTDPLISTTQSAGIQTRDIHILRVPGIEREKFEHFTHAIQMLMETVYFLQTKILTSDPETAKQLRAYRDGIMTDFFQIFLPRAGTAFDPNLTMNPQTFDEAVGILQRYALENGSHILQGEMQSAILGDEAVPFYSLSMLSPRSGVLPIGVAKERIGIQGLLPAEDTQVAQYEVFVPPFRFEEPRIDPTNVGKISQDYPAHGLTLVEQKIALVLDDVKSFQIFRRASSAPQWYPYVAEDFGSFRMRIAINEATHLAVAALPSRERPYVVEGKEYNAAAFSEFLSDFNSLQYGAKAHVHWLLEVHKRKLSRSEVEQYALSRDVFKAACLAFLEECQGLHSLYEQEFDAILREQGKMSKENAAPRIARKVAQLGAVGAVYDILNIHLHFGKTELADRFVTVVQEQMEIVLEKLKSSH